MRLRRWTSFHGLRAAFGLQRCDGDVLELLCGLLEAREVFAHEGRAAIAGDRARVEALRQRVEAGDLERRTLVALVKETDATLKRQEAECARLTGVLRASERRLRTMEDELAQRAKDERQRVEQLTAARGVITRTTAEYEALTREFEQRLAERDVQEAALRASLGAELELLQRALAEQPVVEQLRDEVRELSSQLDDERLKSMALQRALERFAAMGGTIPKQAEGDASTRS